MLFLACHVQFQVPLSGPERKNDQLDILQKFAASKNENSYNCDDGQGQLLRIKGHTNNSQKLKMFANIQKCEI